MCDGCERLSGVAARVGLSKATTCQASPVQRWHSCKRNGIHRGGTRAGVASVLFVRLKTIRPGNLLCLPHLRRPAHDRMSARREAVSVNPRNLASSHSTMRTVSALGFAKPVRSSRLHMCGTRPMLSPRPLRFTCNHCWASRGADALRSACATRYNNSLNQSRPRWQSRDTLEKMALMSVGYNTPARRLAQEGCTAETNDNIEN